MELTDTSEGTLAPDPIIHAAGLAKHFTVRRRRAGLLDRVRGLTQGGDRVAAVAGVSFAVPRGEIVGYIGPNGAGKSTTIKMLTGILVPSAGEATVDGIVPWRQRKTLAHRIGVVFGQRTQLWWDLPLIDSLELLRHVYRVPGERFERMLTTATELLDLDPFLATPVRQLSLGQRMRGDLAAALLHEPPILFLDEPTIGLDVVAKARIRDFLQTINRERGVTIVLTTHDLADIEHLCHRIIVIDQGRVLFDGPLGFLRDRYGTTRRLIVDFEAEVPALDTITGAHVRLIEQTGPRVVLAFDRAALSAAQLIARLSDAAPIRDISIEEAEIEEIIRQIYEGQLVLDSAAP